VLSWIFVAITSGAVLILGLEINEWANAPDNDEGRYVLLYLLLVGFISCATLLLFYYVFHSPILMNVYRGMITGMLFAPLSYFDTTPASKLISRLSSDLAMLDKIVLV
jgi:ABC-type multidrug transport system fused ATPase/permease subunit